MDSSSDDDDAFASEIEGQLLEAQRAPAGGRRLSFWPLDDALTAVVCAFAGRRSGAAAASTAFLAARTSVRRAEKRRALAAVGLPEALAARVEDALWRDERRGRYEARARTLVFALRKNDALREGLVFGATAPETLAALDEEALATPAVARRRDESRRRAAACRAARSRPPPLAEIDAFECPRCGERRTHCVAATHKASIDRSHVLAQCLACHLRWAP